MSVRLSVVAGAILLLATTAGDAPVEVEMIVEVE
jgi:hypothetical protein